MFEGMSISSRAGLNEFGALHPEHVISGLFRVHSGCATRMDALWSAHEVKGPGFSSCLIEICQNSNIIFVGEEPTVMLSTTDHQMFNNIPQALSEKALVPV